MSVISRFPMGAGGSYAEGSSSLTMNSNGYLFEVTGIAFTPKIVFGTVYAYSDTYADTHKTTVENTDGTTVKLLASPNGYSGNPTYTIGEKSFRVAGNAPPGVGTRYGANLSWKAWG